MQRSTKIDALFGKHIQLIRKIRNMSRQEVADKIGVAQQQLAKYESGLNRVSVGRLYKLSEALKVSVQELIPPKLDTKKRLFTAQADSMAAYLWTKLEENQKQNIINIMRELNKK